MVDSDPALEGRVQGTGRVPADEAAAVLAACDLLVQPYIDGVTTRRTSVMAGLINARPVLTTTGHLTEAVWAETQAVAMVAAGDIPALVASAQALLAGGAARAALAARGENTYRARFSIERTIGALRGAVESVPA
jgi:glycosyltransferase involved in cell wall biosynthesis